MKQCLVQARGSDDIASSWLCLVMRCAPDTSDRLSSGCSVELKVFQGFQLDPRSIAQDVDLAPIISTFF